MKRKVLCLVIVGAFLCVLAACGGSAYAAETPPAKGSVPVLMATPPSTSDSYAFVVACGTALEAYAPQYVVTFTETGGALDQQIMLLRRECNFGIGNAATIDEQLSGTGSFEGHPDDGLRLVFYNIPQNMHWFVRSDAGVNSIHDLSGKNFNPSGQGTSNEKDTYRIFDLLGITPEYYISSQSDALTAMQDNRIVGLTKGGRSPESFCIQVSSIMESTLLGLTQQEVDKITSGFRYYSPTVIPGNTYTNNPNDVLTVGVYSGICSTVETDFQMVYDLLMAMYKKDDYWKTATPAFANQDIFENSLNSIAYLHAGAVQAYKDLGYDVPSNLIPPEYEPK